MNARLPLLGVLAVTSAVACGVDHEGPACQSVGAVASAFGDRSTGEHWVSLRPPLTSVTSTVRGVSMYGSAWCTLTGSATLS